MASSSAPDSGESRIAWEEKEVEGVCMGLSRGAHIAGGAVDVVVGGTVDGLQGMDGEDEGEGDDRGEEGQGLEAGEEDG